MGPGSFQWCPVTGQGAMGTNCNTGSSIWIWGRTSLLWGWQSTGTGCPERLWSLLLWRTFKTHLDTDPVQPALGEPALVSPCSTSLIPDSSTSVLSSQWKGLGNRSFGQSITVPICSSSLFTFFCCSSAGPFHRLQSFRMNLLQPRVLYGLQFASLLYRGLLHGLQGNVCSGAWSTYSPSFFNPGDCRAISHLFYSLLTTCPVARRSANLFYSEGTCCDKCNPKKQNLHRIYQWPSLRHQLQRVFAFVSKTVPKFLLHWLERQFRIRFLLVAIVFPNECWRRSNTEKYWGNRV